MPGRGRLCPPSLRSIRITLLSGPGRTCSSSTSANRTYWEIPYRGNVNLEFEIDSENPLPGTQHSIGYPKGVLAGLAGLAG